MSTRIVVVCTKLTPQTRLFVRRSSCQSSGVAHLCDAVDARGLAEVDDVFAVGGGHVAVPVGVEEVVRARQVTGALCRQSRINAISNPLSCTEPG